MSTINTWFKNLSIAQTSTASPTTTTSTPTTTTTTTIPPPSPPDETLLPILRSLHLEGSPDRIFSHPITCHLPPDERLKTTIGFRWFRTTATSNEPIPDVTLPVFHPTVDNVGQHIVLQAYSLKDEIMSVFAQFGPLVMDESLAQEAEQRNTIRCVNDQGDELELRKEQGKVSLYEIANGTCVVSEFNTWQPVPADTRRVYLQGLSSDLLFPTPRERDMATLWVRPTLPLPSLPPPPPPSNPEPPPPPPPVVTAPNPSSTNGVGSHTTTTTADIPSSRLLDLENQIKSLETQLAAALAVKAKSNSAAETGKALAEAQSLRRELDKSKSEISTMSQSLAAFRTTKIALQARVQQLEASLAEAEANIKTNANTITQLRKHEAEHDELVELLNATTERAQLAEGNAKDLLATLNTTQARLNELERLNHELDMRAIAATTECEQAVSRRNAAQQKADSLSKDMARYLRATPGGLEEVEATMRENAAMKEDNARLRDELQATKAALMAAQQRQAAAATTTTAAPIVPVRVPVPFVMPVSSSASMLSSLTGSIATGSGGSNTDEVKGLANILMLELGNQTEALNKLQEENDLLRARLAELQRKVGEEKYNNNKQ